MDADSITCLNGKFMPAAQACVPVSDRGFRFGDGVFETIRLTQGVPYQWELHMARMAQGLAALRITPPEVDLAYFARLVMQKNSALNGFLRISVTRGSGSAGYLPSPDAPTPTWVIEYLPALGMPKAPYRLWRSSYTKPPRSALPGNYKLAQGVNSTLALLEAKENGCDEALQLTSDGLLCEAAAANLFWISDGAIFTPALSTGCLAGTTRAAVIRLSSRAVQECEAPLATLKKAEAAFITNTRLGIMPIIHIAPDISLPADHPLITEIARKMGFEISDYTAENKKYFERNT